MALEDRPILDEEEEGHGGQSQSDLGQLSAEATATLLPCPERQRRWQPRATLQVAAVVAIVLGTIALSCWWRSSITAHRATERADARGFLEAEELTKPPCVNATSSGDCTLSIPDSLKQAQTAEAAGKAAALRAAMQDVPSLLDQARSARAQATSEMSQGASLVNQSVREAASANFTIKWANQQIANATSKEKHEGAVKVSEVKQIASATQMKENAESDLVAARQRQAQAGVQLNMSLQIQARADSLKAVAHQELQAAAAEEKKARQAIAAQRVCVDMHGAHLAAGGGEHFDPIVGDADVSSPAECAQRCKELSKCGQASWSEGDKTCQLSGGQTTEVTTFAAWYNASYCGLKQEKDRLMDLLHVVYAKKPYVPPIKTCSWSDEDCSNTYCCNNVKCDVDFNWCQGYTCYKQDGYFSGCLESPPDETWNGTIIGGPRQTRVIEAAPEGVLVQGTSLFCFAVVSWQAPAPKPFWATEAAMAGHLKEHALSLFQCDEHGFFNGQVTAQAEWGSFSNIDLFVRVWNDVKNDGRYKNHDWIVKVDTDAVFFPARLKQHLNKLRTPQGSRVYLQNINYQFKFMGALEVLTHEALEMYFEMGHTCIRGKHEGGEDFFFAGCLDSIGVDHQIDYDLLQDKYCKTCPDRDNGCTDGWKVAYHFHKKIISWDWCYNEAICGNKQGSCPGGLQVEYVMN